MHIYQHTTQQCNVNAWSILVNTWPIQREIANTWSIHEIHGQYMVIAWSMHFFLIRDVLKTDCYWSNEYIVITLQITRYFLAFAFKFRNELLSQLPHLCE